MAEDVKQDDDIFESPFEAGESDTKEESSTEEEADKKDETEVKTPEPSKTEDEGKEESTEDSKDESDEEAEETEVEEDKSSKAEIRKVKLNGEIRDLVAQRNKLRDEVEKANAEVYQVETTDELVEKGMTELEAKVEAMRQEREMERYNAQIADAQLTIGTEAQRVLDDFPIFNPTSDSYDEELSNEASELLEQNLIKDTNTGQVIGSNVSPYKLYQTLARAAGISATKGQIKAQKATEKMLANADTASSAPKQKEPEKDPIIAIWDSND